MMIAIDTRCTQWWITFYFSLAKHFTKRELPLSVRFTITQLLSGVLLLSCCEVSVLAQDFPNKPIRIFTSEVGGGLDFTARLVGPALSQLLGEPVIIENRGGKVLAPQSVANASPDGYALLLNGTPLYFGPLLEKLPYDPITDFAAIRQLTSSPMVMVVHPSLPAKSVKELIALAKAKPGELNYASGGDGTPSHLGMELFKYMAHVDMVRITYKGTGQSVTDQIAGQVQLSLGTPAAVTPFVKSGQLRALAVTSAEPTALFPGMPTVAAAGLPGFQFDSLFGLWGPAKTPVAIIDRLNTELAKILGNPDLQEKFLSVGMEAVTSSPEQLTAIVRSQMAEMSKAIKAAGITAN